MTDHLIRYNGDQNYCSRCRCSWDRNEDAPSECIPPIMTKEPPRAFVPRAVQRKEKKQEMSAKFSELIKAMDTGDFSKLL